LRQKAQKVSKSFNLLFRIHCSYAAFFRQFSPYLCAFKKRTMSKKDNSIPILPDIYYVQLEDHNYREGPELEYIAYVELHAPPDTSPPRGSRQILPPLFQERAGVRL
jgi:hypothetical protein